MISGRMDTEDLRHGYAGGPVDNAVYPYPVGDVEVRNGTLPAKSKFDKYVDLGLVRARTEGALTIYVYTEFTQYERLWNAVTRQARGLVFDERGRVIVRCLPKFFNSDEPEALMGRPKVAVPVVQDKVDGSLIQVVDDHEHGLVVTSKGSFSSDHANWAREIISEEAMAFTPGLTYIFELIHPDNRIVIDYGDRRELVLLAAVENGTGGERDIYAAPFDAFARVARLDGEVLGGGVNALTENGLVEGVVVNFGGHRTKMKTDEYVRLHRIVTGFTLKTVWEALSGGDSLAFEGMPEEFQSWLEDTIAGLKDDYAAVHDAVCKEFMRAEGLTDKELGLSDAYQYKGLVFALRNGRDIAPLIWRLVKPTQPGQALS